ncbi:hypothetical protein EW026_g7045 [Hermanssonia centrifuga]|uniref:Uncharacterized protein n=1 Tax=Hermanssonia centrifuga TaxID=98765 RepID=A0A4S4K947_9APHY|nr:hypothetical protein EW026_g7045 [Hermanssonia centrifuga]
MFGRRRVFILKDADLLGTDQHSSSGPVSSQATEMPLRVKLRTELERISHILDKNTDDVPSKAEKRLNQIGDVYQKIANASENPSIAIFSDVVSASTSLLQGEMDNFEASCQILMNTLDAVAKIHPFVTIAVLAFKTAVTFEITRRANDKRILALHIDMKDLMSIIAMLQQLAENDLGSDGVSIKDRLGNRMESIAKNIEQCAATCDTMQKKRLIVKVFKSISWETKLKTFSDAFAAHRDGLHRELAMHASLRIEQAVAGVTNLNTTLHGTNTKIDMMMLFEQLRSPEERELWKFIQIKGGPEAFLNDDALMDELVKKNKEESSDPFSKTHALQMELKMGVNELIKENDSLFDRKFQAHQVILIEEMESAMTRLGDRIIGALRTNEVQAYERLTDSNLYELWKEMGWKGGVDARSLVMSLREYFAEHYDSVLFDNADVSPQTTSGPDRWALQYISIPRIRPLLEAFDDDSSSFVTIREMNTFTQARPQNWSLPHWMAYWAVGFQMSLRYYYDRILALLSKMAVVSEKVLDSNRALVDRFMGCAPLRVIEAVLAGIRSSHENDYLDEELFARFKRHVDSEEAKMEKTLQILKYCLDAPNTVAMVLGSGRPEKRLLPLLYLMTNMCFRILKAGCKVTLHRKELIDLANSICTIQSAVSSRLSAVKAMCKLQNLDVKTHLSSFAFSMYYYVEFYEEFMESIYYKNDYHYALQDNDVNEEQGNEDQALFYGPLADEVDLETYDVVKEVYHIAGNLPTGYLPNDALWRGSYTSAGVRFSIGVLSLPVSADSGDGRFYGSGFDTLGEFEIVGQRTGNEIAFNKKYALTEGLTSKWRFEGSINTDIDRIEGVFGHGDFLDDDFQHTHVPSGSVLGTFQVDRRPAYYFLCQPSKEEYRSNRSRLVTYPGYFSSSVVTDGEDS